MAKAAHMKLPTQIRDYSGAMRCPNCAATANGGLQKQMKIKELAEIFQTTEGAIRERLHRSPDTLPRPYWVGRMRRWNPADVEAWIREQVRKAASVDEIPEPVIPTFVFKRKRTRRSRKMREAEMRERAKGKERQGPTEA